MLLTALPAGVLLITLIFHPNADAALGLGPVLIIVILCFLILGLIINSRWLQTTQPEPRWLRPWYARWAVRLAAVIVFVTLLLVMNPTF
jgi:hypothetical protein